ncbi:MAG: carbohydrate ABC transporter permease, partial [Anaerolineales bacterium]
MTRKRSFLNYLWITLLAAVLLVIFLSPFVYMVFTSLKTGEQISVLGSPLWPAAPGSFEYEGEQLEMFTVPLPDGSTKDLAMLKPGRQVSLFIDPDNPEAGPI